MMSIWKQREAVVVTANLRRWFMTNETTLVGIIHNSTNSKEYLEGDEYTFMNMKLSSYPKTEKYGEGHFIATSPTGTCFRLNGSDHI